MAERVRDRVRRILRDHPHTEVTFTDSVTDDTYYHALRAGGSVLFLNPSHRAIVAELRGQPRDD